MDFGGDLAEDEHGKGSARCSTCASSSGPDIDLRGHHRIVLLVADIFQVYLLSCSFGPSDLGAEQDGYRRGHHPEKIEVQLPAREGQEFFIRPKCFAYIEACVDIEDHDGEVLRQYLFEIFPKKGLRPRVL